MMISIVLLLNSDLTKNVSTNTIVYVTFNIEFKPLMHNLMSFTKKTGGAD
jgi:hypothetical protein